MRIRFLKDEKSGFGEFVAGDVEDIHVPEALRLIEAGLAEDADAPTEDKDKPEAPSDA